MGRVGREVTLSMPLISKVKSSRPTFALGTVSMSIWWTWRRCVLRAHAVVSFLLHVVHWKCLLRCTPTGVVSTSAPGAQLGSSSRLGFGRGRRRADLVLGERDLVNVFPVRSTVPAAQPAPHIDQPPISMPDSPQGLSSGTLRSPRFAQTPSPAHGTWVASADVQTQKERADQ